MSERSEALHLINTSLGRFSPPWQRMRPAALPALLTSVGQHRALERAILRVTLNLQNPDRYLEDWTAFADTHPLGLRNALVQLLSASAYRGPQQCPHPLTRIYVGAEDRLVHPDCSRAIAQHWNVPLSEHPRAGHDLPLDDPHWLLEELEGFLKEGSLSDV